MTKKMTYLVALFLFTIQIQASGNSLADDPCLPPINIEVTAITTYSIEFEWEGAGESDPSTLFQYTITEDENPLGGPTTIENQAASTGYMPLSPSTTYNLYLRTLCMGVWSDWSDAVSFTTAVCDIVDMPYFQDFETLTSFNLVECTGGEVISGNYWNVNQTATDGFNGNTLSYSANETQDANSWYIIQSGINITEDDKIKVSFKYGGDGNGSETIRLFMATSIDDFTSGDGLQISDLTFSDDTVNEYVAGPIPFTSTDVYYFAFQVLSDANQGTIYVDDFKVEEWTCGVPEEITADDISADSVTLSWDATGNNQVHFYQYTVSTNADEPDSSSDIIVSGNAINNLVENLDSNTVYYVYVRASCSGVWSDWSQSINFTTMANEEPCLPPINIEVTAITTYSIEFEWEGAGESDPSTLFQYTITEDENPLGGPTTIENQAASTGYMPLSPSTTYNLYLRTLCMGVWSDWSDAVSFTTAACDTVDMPYFQDFETLTSFNLVECTGGEVISGNYWNVNQTATDGFNGNTLSYSANETQDANSWYIIQSGINITEDDKIKVSFKYGGDGNGSETIRLFMATSIDDFTSGDGLQISDLTFSDDTVNEYVAGPIPFTSTDVYYFAFQVLSDANQGTIYVDDFKVEEWTCGVPEEITADDISADSVTLSWDATGNNQVHFYQYTVSTNADEPDSSSDIIVSGNAINNLVENLDSNTVYYVYVRASCSGVWSDWSQSINFTTMANEEPCLPPINIEVTAITTYSIEFEWEGAGESDPSTLFQYTITEDENPLGGPTTIENQAASTGYMPLSPSTTYNLYLRTLCMGVWSDWSDAVSFTTAACDTVDMPYFQDFETLTSFNLVECTGGEVISGNYWNVNQTATDGFNGNTLSYSANETQDANSWYIIQSGINITEDDKIKVSFKYGGDGNGSETIRLFMATSIDDFTSGDGLQISDLTFSDDTVNEYVAGPIPFTSTDVYYFAFQVLSDANQGTIYVDDFKVEEWTCGVPEEITADDISADSVTLSWDATGNNQVHFYQYTVSTNADEPDSSSDIIVSGNAINNLVENLDSNTVYYVYVRASCSGVWSDWSQSINFTTMANEEPCLPPINIEVTAITTYSIEFEWEGAGESDPSTLFQYTITEDENPLGGPTTIENQAASTGYMPLSPSTTYNLYLRTLCMGVWSDWSDAVSFTTAVCDTVDMPYFQDFETLTSFNLVECTGGEVISGNYWNVNQTATDGFNGNTLSYSANETQDANSWYIIQSGINITEDDKIKVSFKYGGDGNGSETIRLFMATSIDDFTSGDGLQISDLTFSDDTVNEYVAGPIPFTSTDVYYFAFQVLSDANQGTIYVDDFKVEEWTCGVPEEITADDISADSVTLSWDATGNNQVHFYQYTVSTNADEPDSSSDIIVSGNAINNLVENLDSNTVYYVYVRASCSGVWSDWSQSINFTTMANEEPCLPPINIEVTAITTYSIEFEWEGAGESDPSTLFQYTITEDENPLGGPTTIENQAASTGYMPLSPSTTYNLYLRTLCMGVWSDWSDAVSFTTAACDTVDMPYFQDFETLTSFNLVECTGGEVISGNYWNVNQTATDGFNGNTLSYSANETQDANSWYIIQSGINITEDDKIKVSFKYGGDGNGSETIRLFMATSIDDFTSGDGLQISDLTFSDDTVNEYVAGPIPFTSTDVYYFAFQVLSDANQGTIYVDDFKVEEWTCGVPEEITADDISADSVTLSWDATGNNQVHFYQYTVSTNADEPDSSSDIIVSGNAINNLVENLDSNTVYYVYVRASCSGVWSDWSQSINFTTMANEEPCLPPINIEVTAITTYSIEFEWEGAGESDPSTLFQYTITEDENPLGGPTTIENQAASTGYMPLSPSTTYNLYLRTLCMGVWSDWSDAVSFTTAVCDTVDMPYFQDFETLTSFNLVECTGGEVISGNYWNVNQTATDGFNGNTLSYSANETQDANSWYIIQSGINITEDDKIKVSFKYGGDGNGSETIRLFMATSIDDFTSGDGLQISDLTFSDDTVNEYVAGPIPFTSTDVYYFAFQVLSDANQGTIYVDDFKVEEWTCGVPEEITADDISADSVTLSWDATGNNQVHFYQYTVSTNADEPDSSSDIIVSGNAINNLVENLDSNTVYYVYVRASCSGVWSDWSQSINFTTMANEEPCLPPINIEVTAITTYSIEFEWEGAGESDPSTLFQYTITEDENPLGGPTTIENQAASTGYMPLSPSTTYNLYLRTLCMGVWSDWSDAVSFTTAACDTVDMPYFQDFETLTSFNLVECTGGEVISGNYWNVNQTATDGFNGNTLSYSANETQDANSWYIIQSGINITEDDKIKVSFKYGGDGNGSETIRLFMATSIDDFTSGDGLQISDLTFSDDTVNEYVAGPIPFTSTDVYYFAFQVLSDANQGTIYVDDFKVEEWTCGVPEEITADDISADSVTLSWDATGNNQVHFYQYTVSTNADEPDSSSDIIVSGNAINNLVENLDSNTVYYVYVRASCSGVWSDWSQSINFTTMANEEPCLPPINIEVTAITTYSIEFEWEGAGESDPSTLFQYTITEDENPLGGPTTIENQAASTGYMPLSPSTTYNLYLRTLCMGVWSDWSDAVSFTTAACDTVDMPYFQDFETLTSFNLVECTGGEVISGNYWNVNQTATDGFNGNTLSYSANETQDANSWYIIQSGINITEDDKIKVSFKYGGDGNGSETIRLFMATSIDDFTSGDGLQISDLTFSDDTVNEYVAGPIPFTSTDVYYFAFQVLSDANQGTIYVDDFKVEEWTCGVPEEITADDISADSVTLSWDATGNNQVHFYQYTVSTNADEPDSSSDIIVSGNAINNLVENLDSNTVYYVYVRASCSGVWSDWSQSINFTTMANEEPCLPPINIEVTAITTYSIEFEWEGAGESDPSTLFQYTITEDENPLGGPTTIENQAASTGYMPLSPSTTYNLYLRTLCMGVWSDWSDAVSFTTAVCDTVDMPYFQDFETLTSFNLVECTGGEVISGNYWNVNQTATDGFNGNTLSYSANETQDANSWYIIQSGINITEDDKIKVSFKYGGDGNGSETIRLFMATSIDDFTSGDGLQISDLTFSDDTVNEYVAGPIPFTSTDVYYFAFQVLSDANQGTIYVDDFKVEEWTCGVPEEITADDISADSVTLSWDATGNNQVHFYQYTVSTNADEPDSSSDIIVSGNAINNLVENLDSNTVYYVYVRASCSGVWSDWSQSINFTTMANEEPCLPPINIEVTAITTYSIEFEWEGAGESDPSTLFQYTITEDENPLGGPTTIENQAASTGYMPLSPSTTYNLYLRTLCMGVWSDWSDAVSFTTAVCDIVDMPYFQDFETLTSFNLVECTGGEVISGNYWNVNQTATDGFNGNTLSYSANETQDANSWYIIQSGINITEDDKIKVSFKYGGDGNGSETIRLFMATSIDDFTSGDGLQISDLTFSDDTVNEYVAGPIPFTSTDVYYFAFQVLSDANQGTIYVDDFKVEEWTCGVPEEITADDISANSVILSWDATGNNQVHFYQYTIST